MPASGPRVSGWMRFLREVWGWRRRRRSQEEDADHEVGVRVAEGLPEELPFEGFGKPGGVVLDRVDEPRALRVGEEC